MDEINNNNPMMIVNEIKVLTHLCKSLGGDSRIFLDSL
jgi:hypothetical protein